jgi:hypothetical protein
MGTLGECRSLINDYTLDNFCPQKRCLDQERVVNVWIMEIGLASFAGSFVENQVLRRKKKKVDIFHQSVERLAPMHYNLAQWVSAQWVSSPT